MQGRLTLDLSQDPPPDLAIEIDYTSSSINRLAIYAALGIPEVWRFDGESLTILGLTEIAYQSQTRSIALPLLQRADLERCLKLGQTMGETSWVKSFRQWLRTQPAQS